MSIETSMQNKVTELLFVTQASRIFLITLDAMAVLG